MNIEEAIQHCNEIAQDTNTCKQCRLEHRQLSLWLQELKAYRALNITIPNLDLNAEDCGFEV